MPEELDDATLIAFALLAELKEAAVARCAALGLTLPQAEALHILCNPCSQRELASRLHCDASNVTGLVDRLEAAGLAKREIGTEDRRVREVVLTDVGRAARDELVSSTLEHSPLQRLTPEERSTFTALVRKMVDPAKVAGLRYFFDR